MTTGPLVLLEVDGHRPGDIIAMGLLHDRRFNTVESPTAAAITCSFVVGGRVFTNGRSRRSRGAAKDRYETILVTSRIGSPPRFPVTHQPDAEGTPIPFTLLNGHLSAADVDCCWPRG
jgi:hypothetical protein